MYPDFVIAVNELEIGGWKMIISRNYIYHLLVVVRRRRKGRRQAALWLAICERNNTRCKHVVDDCI